MSDLLARFRDTPADTTASPSPADPLARFREAPSAPKGTLGAYGATLKEAVKGIPGYVAGAIEGATPYDDTNFLDTLQQKTQEGQDRFINQPDAGESALGGLATKGDIYQAAPSLSGSMASMGPTLAGAALGSMAGPVGTVVGGLAGAGLGLIGMKRNAENQFVKQNIEQANAKLQEQGQPVLTQEQAIAEQNRINATGDTSKIGYSEALPETLGNLAEIGVMASPVGNVARGIGALASPLARAAAVGLAKAGATQLTELGEEEVTRQLQNPIMQRHGFPEQTAGETAKQTAIATLPFALVGGGAGAYQGYTSAKQDITDTAAREDFAARARRFHESSQQNEASGPLSQAAAQAEQWQTPEFTDTKFADIRRPTWTEPSYANRPNAAQPAQETVSDVINEAPEADASTVINEATKRTQEANNAGPTQNDINPDQRRPDAGGVQGDGSPVAAGGSNGAADHPAATEPSPELKRQTVKQRIADALSQTDADNKPVLQGRARAVMEQDAKLLDSDKLDADTTGKLERRIEKIKDRANNYGVVLADESKGENEDVNPVLFRSDSDKGLRNTDLDISTKGENEDASKSNDRPLPRLAGDSREASGNNGNSQDVTRHSPAADTEQSASPDSSPDAVSTDASIFRTGALPVYGEEEKTGSATAALPAERPPLANNITPTPESINEKATDEKTADAANGQGQETLLTPESKDAFTPTPELSDGTPVIKTGDNTFVDASNDEWQDNHAIELKESDVQKNTLAKDQNKPVSIPENSNLDASQADAGQNKLPAQELAVSGEKTGNEAQGFNADAKEEQKLNVTLDNKPDEVKQSHERDFFRAEFEHGDGIASTLNKKNEGFKGRVQKLFDDSGLSHYMDFDRFDSEDGKLVVNDKPGLLTQDAVKERNDIYDRIKPEIKAIRDDYDSMVKAKDAVEKLAKETKGFYQSAKPALRNDGKLSENPIVKANNYLIAKRDTEVKGLLDSLSKIETDARIKARERLASGENKESITAELQPIIEQARKSGQWLKDNGLTKLLNNQEVNINHKNGKFKDVPQDIKDFIANHNATPPATPPNPATQQPAPYSDKTKSGINPPVTPAQAEPVAAVVPTVDPKRFALISQSAKSYVDKVAQGLKPTAAETKSYNNVKTNGKGDLPNLLAQYEKQQSSSTAIASDEGKSSKDFEGDKINKSWTKFADDSGSLNIPRSEMPQVKAEHRGALVNFLNAKGIKHKKQTISAEKLKPTQAEFSPEKVKKAQDYEGGNRSILISSDNHVVDGHHQWLAKLNNKESIDVIRLNKPIKSLLNDVKEFPSAEQSGGAKSSLLNQEPNVKEARTPEKTPQGEAAAAKDIDNKLREGKISVAEYQKETGLTDDEVDSILFSKYEGKTEYKEKINALKAAVEDAKSRLKKPTKGAGAEVSAYSKKQAAYSNAIDTLNIIEKNFEHPFNNNLISRLPEFLKIRYGKQWENIATGDKAKKEYYKASDKIKSEAIINFRKGKAAAAKASVTPQATGIKASDDVTETDFGDISEEKTPQDALKQKIAAQREKSTLKPFTAQVDSETKSLKLKTPDAISRVNNEVKQRYEAQIKQDVSEGKVFTKTQLNDIADNELEHLLDRDSLTELGYTKDMQDQLYAAKKEEKVDALVKFSVSESSDIEDDSDSVYRKIMVAKGKSPYRTTITNVRGGWTKDKIRNELKRNRPFKASGKLVQREIAKFDSPDDFSQNIFYHGTGNGVSNGLKPSIVMSERDAEKSGGGGYGERYWAISLSKNKEKASNFTGMSSFGTVYPVILKKDAKVISMPEIEDAAELDDIIVDLWNQGIDAVKIGNWEDKNSEEELAVLNPHAIFKYENPDHYAVFQKKKFTPLTNKQIEDIYNKAKAEIPNLNRIKLLPRAEREEELNKLEKFKFSTDKRKEHQGSTRETLINSLSAGDKKLLQSGRLNIVQKTGEVPKSAISIDANGVEGFYDPKTGSIWVISDNVTPDNLQSVLLHEKLHASIDQNPKLKERLLGTQSELNAIFKQVESGQYTGRYKAIYDKAMQRVDMAKTTPEARFEEWLAYQITEYTKPGSNLPERLLKAIKDMVAVIKAAIFKYSGQIANISPADLSALARSSLSYSEKSNSSNAVVMASKQGYQGNDTGEAEEWLRAKAKGLDMSKRARMERAKAMGFDTSKVWYHGTAHDLMAFTPKDPGDGMGSGEAIYLTAYPEDAYSYANREFINEFYGRKNTNAAPVIYPMYVRNRVPVTTDNGFSESYVNSPGDLRSINAAFDPDYADSPNLLASVKETKEQQEYDATRAKYFGTKDWMKAPNGKPTKLNEVQWVQTRTPAFREWFGDWLNDPENASKVVDTDTKEPMVVYHGTDKSFNKINMRKGAQNLFWFTSDKAAIEKGDVGAQGQGKIIELFANIKNPANWKQYDNLLIAEFKGRNLDGAILPSDDSFDGFILNGNQVKSAIKNTGAFSPQSNDIRYSVAEDVRQVQERLTTGLIDRLSTNKTFNWWHKTVGTQFHKALINKHFNKVFSRSMQFEQDLAKMANEAADLAPSLLPKLDALTDIGRELTDFAKGAMKLQTSQRIKDARKVGEAVFETTLMDKPMTTRELQDAGYTPAQQTMYREFFASVNKSLDDLAKSELFRMARALKLDQAPDTLNLKDTADWYANQTNANEGKDFIDKAAQIAKLKDEGYAPLMRFGQYTVDVVSTDGTEKREFFGMFETEQEAKEMERIMQSEYPDADITRGVMSQNDWQMFKGITPETMEIFAKMMNVEQDDAFQTYLKSAVTNRSAMKRLIHRKKMPGFARDTQRVLASFITSNARMASKNYHLGELVDAIASIPKEKGDVIDEAVNLYNYVQNPSAKGAAIRGLLFAWYLGGSVSSAAVNLTQSLTTTLPYLHQFGSTKQVSKILANAMKQAANHNAITGGLGKALRQADKEGITEPHEIHSLYGESMRTGLLQNQALRPIAKVWGSLFSLAESYNRRVAFIAAHTLATENGIADPFKFAEAAVNQTQFVYSKSARPNWARSTVGQMVFTFKTFTISYMEFLKRLPAKEQALALGVLVMFAGLGGAPGADDLDDLIDTLGQAMGYNTNSKAWKEKVLDDMIGKEAAQYALYGISHGLPIDVSSRLGVGNIIPGTGLLKKSETDKTRDVMEFVGPVGSLSKKIVDAFEAAGSRDSLTSQASAVGKALVPKAISDVAQAIDMMQTGQYRDARGRKVSDADMTDALSKLLGFQPTNVAEPRRAERYLNQSVTMAKAVESDIASLWASGVVEKNRDKVDEAKAMLKDWNEKNADTPIKVNMKQILSRVRQMRLTSGDRLLKSTPKELRKYAREAMRD